VYSKVWDVDDPFDRINNTMLDIALIDFNMAGPDNRLPGDDGEDAQAFTDDTDENGKATVTITVSMPQGDNYRTAAADYPNIW
jgi:hypothetical protein